MIARRNFLKGLGSLIVAPSIVRVESLMPIKVIDPAYYRYLIDYSIVDDSMILRMDKALFPLPIPKSIIAGGVLTEAQVKLRYPETFKIFKDTQILEYHQQKCCSIKLASSAKFLPSIFDKWELDSTLK